MKARRKLLCGKAASTGLIAGLLSLALMPAAAAGNPGAISSSPITEFKVQSKWINGLAQGPDGTIWYTGTIGNAAHWESRIGRVGPSGPVSEAPMPGGLPAARITVGPEGDAWLLSGKAEVVRLTPSGAHSQVAIAPRGEITGHATAARDGGIWFTTRGGGAGPDTIGRIDTGGVVTEFPLPQPGSQPAAIVEASNGDAWFTEYSGDRIGRMTPSGQLTEFTLPEGSRPSGIAADTHGDIWFTEQGPGRIGRIDAAGKLTQFELPADVFPGEIAAASDGRLWFIEWKHGAIGHLTPAGRFREVTLPDRESDAEEVIAGSEGDVWYAASGEGPCVGGGYTCQMWEPRNPAIIGRISPTPLLTVIKGRRVRLRHRGVDVRLDCEGGEVWERCRGRLTLKRGGKVLGSSGYSLAADQRHLVHVRLKRSVWSVFGSDKKTRVKAVVVASDGHGVRHGITLVHR